LTACGRSDGFSRLRAARAAVFVVYVLVAAGAIWFLDKLVGPDIFLRSK
jgi:uncharacterized membrane protein YqjE